MWEEPGGQLFMFDGEWVMSVIGRDVYLFLVGILAVVILSFPVVALDTPVVTCANNTSSDIIESDNTEICRLLGSGFIPNMGQYDPEVAYVLQYQRTTVFFTRSGLVLTHTSDSEGIIARDMIRQTFGGASPDTKITAQGERPGRVNYYVGNDSSEWLTGIPVYAEVVYNDLYPGIDLFYTEEKGKLKREFRVAPGASPSNIELLYDEEITSSVDDDGILRFASPTGEMLESPLICWQVIDGKVIPRTAVYLVEEGSVRIVVGGYDSRYELIIDPELVYSSYLGGNYFNNNGNALPDGSGGVWVAGYTASTDFPVTADAYQSSIGGDNDAFLSRFSSTGALLYSTYLGGGGIDYGFSLAPDGYGGVWVAGGTDSNDFPVTNDAYQGSIYNHNYDAFITHFSSTGSLLYSTYLGGSVDDYGSSLAIDGSGGVWVAGGASSNFPVTADAYQSSDGGSWDVFVSRFSSTGALLYSTYIGGSGSDQGSALAADGSGGVWVAGGTDSNDFPVTADAYQSSHSGGEKDAFLSRFTSTGDLLYSTYLGGDGDDQGRALAPDGSGGVWVAGWTESTNFPVTADAYQSSDGGSWDVFVSRFSSTGALLYSTSFGENRVSALAPDGYGGVWVAGSTFSTDFPVTADAYQSSHSGGESDAFLSRFSSSGALLYSTYLGGSGEDKGNALAPDGAGGVWVAGYTGSTNFPVTADAFHGSYSVGYWDAFIARFSDSGGIPTITSLNPPSVVEGSDGFTLVVTGTNFVDGATVLWDGEERATVFVSATELNAAIFKDDIALEGTYQVKVVNPDGTGSGEMAFHVGSGMGEVKLNVPLYSQMNPAWSNDILGTGTGTVGYYGCALTSTAMVFSYLSEDVTPKILNQWLIGNNGYVNYDLIDWSRAADYSSDIRYVGRFDYNGLPEDINRIKEAINKGNPVIANVRYTGDGLIESNHFVVITGYNNNTFFVNDPADGTERGIADSRYATTSGQRIFSIRMYENTEASSQPLGITAVSPNGVIKSGTSKLIISGTGFKNNCIVQIKQHQNPHNLFNAHVSYISSSTVYATLDFTHVSEGPWDLFIQNPDGESTIKERAITVEKPTAEPRKEGASITITNKKEPAIWIDPVSTDNAVKDISYLITPEDYSGHLTLEIFDESWNKISGFSSTPVQGGKGSIPWDGKVDGNLVNPANNPYQIRLIITTSGSGGLESKYSEYQKVFVGRPVLFVHGILSLAEDIEANQGFQDFRQNHYAVTVEYADGKPSTVLGNIPEFAENLETEVSNKLTRTGAEKVDIVSHSMGGLVSRFYIEKQGGRKNVGKLIMIQTPNHGSEFLEMIKGVIDGEFLPHKDVRESIDTIIEIAVGETPIEDFIQSMYEKCSLGQMKPHSTFLRDLNDNEEPYECQFYVYKGMVNDKIEDPSGYLTIASDRYWFLGMPGITLTHWDLIKIDFPWGGKFYQQVMTPTNKGDGVVPYHSALLTGISSKAVDGGHLNPWGNSQIMDYVEQWLSQSDDGKLINLMKKSVSEYNSEINEEKGNLQYTRQMSIELNQVPDEVDYGFISNILSIRVTPEQPINITSSIEPFTEEVKFFLAWEEGALSLDFMDPDGTVVNSIQTENTSVVFSANGMPGNWTVKINPDIIPEEGIDIKFYTYEVNPIIFSILNLDKQLLPGEPTPILVYFGSDTTPIIEASVNATLKYPDRSSSSISLYDNGDNGDTIAGDGIYSYLLPDSSIRGTYLIEAQGSFNHEGFTISRSDKNYFTLMEYPDLCVTSEDIVLSPDQQTTGNISTISATISNIGFNDATNVSVSIYDEVNSIRHLLKTDTLNISAGSSSTTSTPWKARPGAHTIIALVGSCDEVVEYTYSNNIASRDLFIEPTQITLQSANISIIKGQTERIPVILTNCTDLTAVVGSYTFNSTVVNLFDIEVRDSSISYENTSDTVRFNVTYPEGIDNDVHILDLIVQGMGEPGEGTGTTLVLDLFDGLNSNFASLQFSGEIVIQSDPSSTTLPFPNPAGGSFSPPTDTNGDGLYEDLDGNGWIGFNDVVVFYNNLDPIDSGLHGSVTLFDYDGNGWAGFNDIVLLYEMIV